MAVAAGRPPAGTEQVLYLGPAGMLGTAPPAADAPAATFTYDPADPTPTVGGRLLAPPAGVRTDSALAERADVRTFTGPPLPAPAEVVGVPVLELAHSRQPVRGRVRADQRGRPEGRSRNVCDGFGRLDPTAPDGVVRLRMDATAHRFRAGNRIRLLIGGGSLPRWDRNLGTGEDPATSAATAPSHRTITVADGASRLILPTVG